MPRSDWEDLADVAGLEDEYEIVAELGRGGSAIVYRARDRALGRDVAIKVVRSRAPGIDEEHVARLAREARTVAQLDHPRIVRVYAVKALVDGLALIMQWIPGRTLKQRVLEEGPLAVADAAAVLRDVAAALAYAHERGVVHRDVKPENIFLDAHSGHAMLSDFGIALTGNDTRLTMTGTAIGTPTYMAPELIDGGHADARADVYSLGLVAWEILTGQQPWAGDTLYGVIYRQKHEYLPPIDVFRDDVPERLQYVVERALQKRTGARWAGAGGWLAQIDGSVLPPDWPQWQAARARRRRERGLARDGDLVAGTVAPGELLATRRYRKGDLTTDAAAVAAPAQSTASSEHEGSPREGSLREDEPDWAYEPVDASGDDDDEDARVERRVWPLAIAAALVLAISIGMAAALRRDRASPTSVAVMGREAGTSKVVPVLPQASIAHNGAESTADAEVFAVRSAAPASAAAESAAADSAAAILGDEGAATDGALPSPKPRDDWPDSVEARPMSPSPANRRNTAASPRREAGASVRQASATVPAGVPLSLRLSSTDDAQSFAPGGRHTCALRRSRVLCWGANDEGQLGSGSTESSAEPAALGSELSFQSISSGVAHSCGVARGGAIYCWGDERFGQLGDATTVSRNAPVRVASSLSFAQVRAGRDHSCAMTDSAMLACWGRNDRGQLGDGSTVGRSTPVLVAGLRVASVAVGWNHTCAIDTAGAVHCWGSNSNGQLGDGTTTTRTAPVDVAPGMRFTSIAAGSAHTCAVSRGGDVWCWGRTLGGSQPSPVRVSGLLNMRSVTAGTVHSCARNESGSVWCWGRNDYGQLGTGSTVDAATPQRVDTAVRFSAVHANGAHTCGMSGAQLWCWGFNADGQLGDGTSSPRTRPVRVTSFD